MNSSVSYGFRVIAATNDGQSILNKDNKPTMAASSLLYYPKEIHFKHSNRTYNTMTAFLVMDVTRSLYKHVNILINAYCNHA